MCREGTFFIIIIQLVASWWLKSLVHSHCYTISDLCVYCFDCRAFDVNGETSLFDIVDFGIFMYELVCTFAYMLR